MKVKTDSPEGEIHTQKQQKAVSMLGDSSVGCLERKAVDNKLDGTGPVQRRENILPTNKHGQMMVDDT